MAPDRPTTEPNAPPRALLPAPATIPMSAAEFDALRTLLYEHVGINVASHKRTLMVARLSRLLHKLGLNSYTAYYQHVVNDTTGQALDALVNHMTTNYTYLNREPAHFEFLASQALPQILDHLYQSRERHIRVWSAGCSTGEEPYTLAMFLHAALAAPSAGWHYGVLATDVDRQVLETARRARYTSEQVARLPDNLRRAFLTPGQDDTWTVCPAIRNLITFRRFNLVNKQFPFRRPFHLIFCRNVMIYFDQDTQCRLVRALADFTTPNGYLFISHAETLDPRGTGFQRVAPSIYRKDAGQ